MAPRRLSGGQRRRRPAAPRFPADSASPPSSLATSGGQRRRRSAAPRFPTDGVSPLNNPRDSQRTALHRPTVLHPPLADVVDTTRRPFDPRRTPTLLSLVVPVVPAYVLPAPCVSLLPRRTATCQLRVKRCGVFPSASGHGNKSPSRIPQEAADRKKDTSRQYIAAMYSNKANHGKN